MARSKPQKTPGFKAFLLPIAVGALAVLAACAPDLDDYPATTYSTTSSTSLGMHEELIPSSEYRDPTVPQVGGSPLPTPGDLDLEEIDCEEAEYELCDTGEWACDDIADYCDVVPDGDGGLPDDWDWDR